MWKCGIKSLVSCFYGWKLLLQCSILQWNTSRMGYLCRRCFLRYRHQRILNLTNTAPQMPCIRYTLLICEPCTQSCTSVNLYDDAIKISIQWTNKWMNKENKQSIYILPCRTNNAKYFIRYSDLMVHISPICLEKMWLLQNSTFTMPLTVYLALNLQDLKMTDQI